MKGSALRVNIEGLSLTLSDMGTYCFSTTWRAFARLAAGLFVVAGCSGSDTPAPPASEAPTESTFEDTVAVVRADPDSGVTWRVWGDSAFAEARREGRPVLLYVARPGCDGLFAGDDPLARWQAETRYLPVRLDPDRHPDVARRYAPAGCPSLSILTVDRTEIVRATDIPPRNVPLLLSRIHEHLQKRPEMVDKKVEEYRSTPAPQSWDVRSVRDVIVAEHDPVHGGFGEGPRFPETEVLRLLQELDTAGDAEAGRIWRRTIDALLASPVWAGQVQALSYTSDWRSPRREAAAADQAGLLHVFRSGSPGSAGGSANYRQVGQALIDTLTRHWFDETSRAFRHRRPYGATDFVDANALLLRALLSTAADLDREEAVRRPAQGAAQRVIDLVEADGAVRHSDAPDAPRGRLRDQMLVSLALSEWADYSDDDGARTTAARVRAWSDSVLWREEDGVYADAPDVTAGGDVADGRAPSGRALAAEDLLARGDTTRARQLLSLPLLSAPGRRHAGIARQLLRLDVLRLEVHE